MKLILNEVSFDPAFANLDDDYQITKGMKQILSIYEAIGREYRLQDLALVYKSALSSTLICLISKIHGNRDLKNILTKIITKHPLIHENLLYYYCFEDKEIDAQGLGYAYEYDFPAISFDPNDVWQNEQIKIITVKDIDDELREECVNAKHIPYIEKNQKLFISPYFECYKIKPPKNWDDLLLRREELYPYLNFKEEFEKWSKDHQGILIHHYEKFHAVFSALNKCLSDIKSDSYIYNEVVNIIKDIYNSSRESESRRTQLLIYLRYTIDGVTKESDWHAKINTGGFRVYFFIHEKEPRITIGYVGVHL